MRVSVVSKLLNFKDDVIVRVRLAHVEVEVRVPTRSTRAMREMLKVHFSCSMSCICFSKVPHFTAISSHIRVGLNLECRASLATK